MRSVVCALLVAAALTAGCSGNSTTTTAPTVSGSLTEVFVGSLAVNDANFYSFTVSSTGTTSVMLASVTSGVPGPAADLAVGVGIGVPAGIGCPVTVTTAVNIGPALTAQIATTLSPGIYCVNISDIGNLRAPVNFAIRIIHT